MTETTTAFRTVAQTAEIDDGDVTPFYLEDLKHRVSITRVAGRLYAFADLCPCAEDRCPLSAGRLTGTTIMCQCHGSEFDIASGAVVRGPATTPLVTYEVREAGSAVEVAVPGTA